MSVQTLWDSVSRIASTKRFWLALLTITILGYAEQSRRWSEPLRLGFAELLVSGTDVKVRFAKLRSLLANVDSEYPPYKTKQVWVQVETLRGRGQTSNNANVVESFGLDRLLPTSYAYGIDMPIEYKKKRAGFGRSLIVAAFEDTMYIYAASEAKNDEDVNNAYKKVVGDIFKEAEIESKGDCVRFEKGGLDKYFGIEPRPFITPLEKETQMCEAFRAVLPENGWIVDGQLYVLQSQGGSRTIHLLLASAPSDKKRDYEGDHQRFLISLTPIYPGSMGNASPEQTVPHGGESDANVSPSPEVVPSPSPSVTPSPEETPNTIGNQEESPNLTASPSPVAQSNESIQSESAPIEASDVRYGRIVGETFGSRVNVRKVPSTEDVSPHYGLVGDEVEILQETISDKDGRTWYRVRFPRTQAEGWIRGDFIQFQ